MTDTRPDPRAHRRRPRGRPDGPQDVLRPAARHRGRRRGRRRLRGRGDGPPARARRRPDGPADAEHGRRHRDRPDQGRAARDRDRDDDLVHRGGEGHRPPSRPARRATSSRTPRPRRSPRPSAPRTPARSTSIRPSPACSPSGCATSKSPEDELAEPLTEREKDVLRLLGQGMSNKEIGADAVHHRADRPDLRLEHPGQARARVAHAGGALRGRAQAGRRARSAWDGADRTPLLDRDDPVRRPRPRGVSTTTSSPGAAPDQRPPDRRRDRHPTRRRIRLGRADERVRIGRRRRPRP